MQSEPSSEEAGLRRRLLMLISYDGTNYSGFALQNNAPTIVGELRRALSFIDPSAGSITGSSRTDSGVHARNQPISFTTEAAITNRGWVLLLNQRLPSDIRVNYAADIETGFDPRLAPIFKRYRYRIYNCQADDPFIGRVSWRIGQPLDVALMQEQAVGLVGTHDFRAFRSADDIRTETVRTISSVEVSTDLSDARRIDIAVTGNRFMYNMVRIIVGTLADIGRGQLSSDTIQLALKSGDRKQLGVTAPACGLMLEHVELPDWGSGGWPDRTVFLGCVGRFP